MKYYTATDVIRMAIEAGYYITRSGFNLSLKPKLDELEIGIRFGNNRTPIFYTPAMAQDILTWIIYRAEAKKAGRIPDKAPYSAADILGILCLADTLRTAGNRDNTAMNIAMDTATSIIKENA